MTSTYNISGTISKDNVTIDKFMVGEKDVMETSDIFKDDKNIENIKNNKIDLINLVKAEVNKKTDNSGLDQVADLNTIIKQANNAKVNNGNAVIPADNNRHLEPNILSGTTQVELNEAQNAAQEFVNKNILGKYGQNGGGLFRSPSANLKLAMNNPFATAISSSNNIARDMLTNTVSKTLKTATRNNNATKRFRRLFKTKRRNSNKKARKYTRYRK